MKRREWLKLLSSAVCLPLFSPILANASMSSGRRVILIELAGANDGLNTLVPYSNDHYYKLRPQLALTGNSRIALDENFAINSSLQPLLTCWEAGELALVHGLGYPQPNRSHFKSMALWESGGDGVQQGKHGWLTHDIEHAYAANQIDAHGLSLGGGMGIFSSEGGNWLTMSSAGQFDTRGVDNLLETSVDQTHNPGLALVAASTATLNKTLAKISKKLARHPYRVNLGQNSFAQQASHAVKMIHAGVDAPVLKLSLGGFDTHERQRGRHERQLEILAQALSGIRRELKTSDHWNSTLLLTYSEFGRRAAENRSGGTDHGTAAVHMVMGGGVRGGYYGEAPSLDNLLDGDLRHTMDYRAVYSSVLGQWFGLAHNQFARYHDSRLDAVLKA